MTDRELLELAAKAAGYNWKTQATVSKEGKEIYYIKDTHWVDGRESRTYWNPLTDDGDALRLAVKLEIDLFTRTNINGKFIVAERRDIKFCPAQLDSIDPYAATRRAIVRAAAEIERNK